MGEQGLGQLGETIAETKVANKARSLGRDLSDKELGIVVTQVRKYLSTSVIRAQGLCLLNRLCLLGEGAREAAVRRDLARRLEEDRRRERLAYYTAHARYRGLSREGQIVVT